MWDLIHTQAIIENSDIIEGSNIFGYELSNQLYSVDSYDGSKNLWISPFCIASCFSLIYPAGIVRKKHIEKLF